MAKATSQGWTKAPDDLNLWKPKKAGEQLEGLAISVNPSGPFGLQIKVQTTDGKVVTLPSHKVLQSRFESVLPHIIPGRTMVRVTFDGRKKSAKWPTPMEMYSVEYRSKTGEDDVPF